MNAFFGYVKIVATIGLKVNMKCYNVQVLVYFFGSCTTLFRTETEEEPPSLDQRVQLQKEKNSNLRADAEPFMPKELGRAVTTERHTQTAHSFVRQMKKKEKNYPAKLENKIKVLQATVNNLKKGITEKVRQWFHVHFVV